MQHPGRSAFFRMLLSYLSVLVVPLLGCLLLYYSAVSSVTKSVNKYTGEMLNQMIGIIDIRLQELESIAYSISQTPDILRALGNTSIPEGDNSFYEVYEAYSSLPKFSLTNSMINTVQVVMLNNRFVISETSALRWTEQTYPILFPYSSFPYEEFWNTLNTQFFYNSFVEFRSPSGEITPALITSVDYNNIGQPIGVIIITLKPHAISALLQDAVSGPQDFAIVLNEENEIVSSYQGPDCTFTPADALEFISSPPDGHNRYKDYIISNVQSSYNGWNYYIFSLRSSAMATVRQTKITVLVIIFSGVIASIVFAFLLCRHKAAALKQLLCYLGGVTEKVAMPAYTEYEHIAAAASELVASQHRLAELTEKQKPLWDAAVLRNFLLGDIYRPEDARYLFDLLSIKPSHQLFAVALVYADTSGENVSAEYRNYPALTSTAIHRYIADFEGFSAHCLDIDSICKAVVIVSETADEKAFSAQLQEFASSVHACSLKESGIQLTFYISDVCSQIDDVHRAYQQVTIISQQSFPASARFLYTSSDIPEIQRLYYFPLKVELSLVKRIRKGNREELDILLNHLKSENFQNRSLSNSMRQQLISSVRGAVLREMTDISPESAAYPILSKLNSASSFDQLSSILQELCDIFCVTGSLRAEEKKESQKQAVLEYISAHYQESSFSIYQICDVFQMSESAAYQFFREVVGTSFADLIESIRIEKACQLLSDGSHTIKEIAQMVGYTNDNSFRRAFKRVLGISPSEYKTN